MGKASQWPARTIAFAGCAINIPVAVFLYRPIASSSVTCAMPLRLASAVGRVRRQYLVCVSALGVLAAKSAHGVTGVATFILLADICNQRLWTLHFGFEGGDQRVFRVKKGAVVVVRLVEAVGKASVDRKVVVGIWIHQVGRNCAEALRSLTVALMQFRPKIADHRQIG
jgi:hypothetical protein